MVILEKIRAGDILMYGSRRCMVIYRLRRDAALKYYHTYRPVFRCRFLNDGKGIMLSPKTAGQFKESSADDAGSRQCIAPEDLNFLEELAAHIR